MLSVAGEHPLGHNPAAALTMFGQELNDESYATCKADMLIKGQDVRNIVPGNTLSDDGHAGRKFDYMLSNPPFGVEWKKVQKEIEDELLAAKKLGFSGGEGNKGGGAEVKRIMQMTLEEHLKNYDLDELTGPNIYIQLKKGFQDQIEKTLHDLFPDFPADHRFVDKVVLTNLLVQ